MSNLANLPSLLAARNWADRPSAADLQVKSGDLWVMSWDRAYQGLVCVAAVKQGYILGWPVTLPDEPAFAPSLVVEQTPLVSRLFLWPTRETGVGSHLLHRSLGNLIDPQEMPRIAWALEDGEHPGLAFAQGSAVDEANAAADEEMVERWAALCFHTWPETELNYLSETNIKKAGGTSMRAAKCLDMAPPDLRPLWIGVQPATKDQLNALATDLGVEPSELLAVDPLREAIDRLAEPVFKEPILEMATRAGIGEGAARARTRVQYALAARDDSLGVSDTRLLDAIKRAAEAT